MEVIYPYFVRVAVQEPTQAGSARREAARIATFERVSENDIGRVSVVVTEAANNVVKHGGGGEILLRALCDGRLGMEVLALDKGQGMHDVLQCMRDGYSTSGTPGTGLGAMQRMSDVFEVFSVPGCGTVVHCEIRSGKDTGATSSERMESGVVIVPVAGEVRCGDGWAEHHTETHSVYMVVDGLGHGPGAAEAAEEAVKAFRRIGSVNPLDILDEAHHSLRQTRGAALSVASIDHNTRKVRFAGIGNVSGSILSAATMHNMVSHNGIVGHAAGRIQDFTYDWPLGATLVLFSDGIASHWSLGKYPGMQSRTPLVMAAALYRDHNRRRDDATVLIARERATAN